MYTYIYIHTYVNIRMYTYIYIYTYLHIYKTCSCSVTNYHSLVNERVKMSVVMLCTHNKIAYGCFKIEFDSLIHYN